MRLQECLPEGCIDYVEEDVKVILPCHCTATAMHCTAMHCHATAMPLSCQLTCGISTTLRSHVVRKCQEHACNSM